MQDDTGKWLLAAIASLCLWLLIGVGIALSGSGCASQRYRASAVPASWHWPCARDYLVVTSIDDPDWVHLAVRSAVGKINAAAGYTMLRYVGRRAKAQASWLRSVSPYGVTMVRLADEDELEHWGPGQFGGALPIYSKGKQCIDRWRVTLRKPRMSSFETVVLHELGHVAGVEHIMGTIMAPIVPPATPAELDGMTSGIIRCLGKKYQDGQKHDTAIPMGGCVSLGK